MFALFDVVKKLERMPLKTIKSVATENELQSILELGPEFPICYTKLMWIDWGSIGVNDNLREKWNQWSLLLMDIVRNFPDQYHSVLTVLCHIYNQLKFNGHMQRIYFQVAPEDICMDMHFMTAKLCAEYLFECLEKRKIFLIACT